MSLELAKRTQTRFVKTQNKLKSSNFEFDLNSTTATSYDWWIFVTKENGKVIFNNYSYSVSTRKHQSKAWRILGYEADLTLQFTAKSLNSLREALNEEIRLTNDEINNIFRQIAKKGSRKATNEKRMERIEKLNQHIRNVVEML